MTRRFQVPIDELEAQTRVADGERVELQAEPHLPGALVDGPRLHPFGDGATGADADGD